MKTLVIGGNGFIGSHLVDYLSAQRWEVSVLDNCERRYDPLPEDVHYIHGNINQPYLLREALAGVDIVYHLAWGSIHETSNQNILKDIQTNLNPSIELLEHCVQSGIKKVVFASSGGTIYGPPKQLPIKESYPKKPISSYGILKLTVEKYLHLFKHLFGLDYVVIRPSVPFGPRQNPLGRQGVIAVFLYRISKGMPITIWGDGQITRDYFYISDLAEAFVKAGANNTNNRAINIGGAQMMSLMEIVRKMEEIIGKKAIIEFRPARSFDIPCLQLDISEAKRALDWCPKVSFDDGLARTWKWISTKF